MAVKTLRVCDSDINIQSMQGNITTDFLLL